MIVNYIKPCRKYSLAWLDFCLDAMNRSLLPLPSNLRSGGPSSLLFAG